MGLAPYGKEDPNIKSFILDDGYTVDSNLFYRTRFGANFIPYDYLPPHVEACKHRKTFSKTCKSCLETSRRFSNSHVISSHRCT